MERDGQRERWKERTGDGMRERRKATGDSRVNWRETLLFSTLTDKGQKLTLEILTSRKV